jgi:hypothetical protein
MILNTLLHLLIGQMMFRSCATCVLEKSINTYEIILYLMELIRINSKIYLAVKNEIEK